MANRHMKRCSASLINREMQTKTMKRDRLMLVRMAIRKTWNKCWQGEGERGASVHCWWEYKQGQSLCKNCMEMSQKVKNRTTVWSNCSTSGYLLKKTRTLIQEDTCVPQCLSQHYIQAKIWKQPKCPSTDELTKMCYIHTMEYYVA